MVEAARERWENIEFPILTPRSNDALQEPTAEESQIKGLLYENSLLKEEVEVLRNELEKCKEVCKKQVEKRLHTLVEVALQLEGSPPDEEGDELDKVVYPECSEVFYQLGYKVIVHAFLAQIPA